MGDVIQLRDYQNPKDLERLREQMAAEIMSQVSETIPYGGAGIDGMLTDKEPA